MSRPSQIRHDLELALRGEPREAVAAVRRLGADDLPWLEDRVVRLAREHGYTWAKIGRLLGRSRQAVTKRFAAIDGTPQPLPLAAPTDEQRIMAAWHASVQRGRRWREFQELGPRDVVPW